MRWRRLLTLAVIGSLAAPLVGCSETDGRTLPPADPAKTTTTPSTPVIQPSADAEGFTLRSPAFSDGGALPERLTCRGVGISPELSWVGTPSDAVALALVARDTTAGDLVHWVVTGIDPSVQGIGEGGTPENALDGLNGSGEPGWWAPCPPAGTGTHTYEIALLALPAVVLVPPEATADAAAALLEASAGERAVLAGTVTASDAP